MRSPKPESWQDTAAEQIALLASRSANDSRIPRFAGDMRPDATQRRQAARQARRSRRALRDTFIEFAPAAVVLLVLIAIGISRKF